MTWFTISEATKKVPTTNGKRVGTATIWRWCTQGIRGVKLEHARFGRRIVISDESLDRFAVELARAWTEREPKPAKPVSTATHETKSRTAAQRERAIIAAEAKLRERGCMSPEGTAND